MGVTHLSGLQVAGVPTMGMGGLMPYTGNWYFVDYYRGSDGNEGTADSPFKTIYKAYSKMVDGHNDVCAIIPAPLTASTSTGTQRLSAANAALIDSSATTGTLTWAKSACHLIGLTAPTGISPRARIAPETTDTAALFGNTGNMVNVTASGCIFANFQLWGGFATGNASSITWTDAGSRNYYYGVHIAGQADAASAATNTSRTLKITGQEHVFERCTIGIDTVQRITAGSRTLEFANGSARCKFIECDFPLFLASAAASTVSVYAAVGGLDRWTKFERCCFLNTTIPATGTAQTAVFSLASGAGGQILLNYCTAVKATDWADATATELQLQINGAAPTNNTSGLAVDVEIT